jgi:putative alpha-1,2-mannosidase
MSAWYIFNALGMYPEIPGVGGVTVLNPLFPRATLNLPNGHKIVIRAENASRENKYVQSMEINGKVNSKLWLSMDELKNGATLKYVMGSTPNKNWGTGPADAPPSFEPDPATTQ